MQVIKLKRGTLALPLDALEKFGANAQFTMIATGDTIILKKVTAPRLSEIAERAPTDQPLSDAEIRQEIKNYRRGRRARH